MTRISKNQIIKLQKRYTTDESIASLFGVSRQAVHQARKKFGITPIEGKLQERDQQIARQYGDGVSGVKLAHQYGLSLSQIYRITGKQNVKRSNGQRMAGYLSS